MNEHMQLFKQIWSLHSPGIENCYSWLIPKEWTELTELLDKQAIRNKSCFLPDRRTDAVLFTLADTLGQGSEHQLPGLCGGRGCGHDVAPLTLARHVDTIAVNCET